MISDTEKAQFEKDGFLVVQDVIQGALLDDIRREAGLLVDALPPGEQRKVWHERVLFRRRPFREIFKIEKLVGTARDLIGNDVQLLAMDLLYTKPKVGGISWHRDVTFVCNKTLSMNTGIYLYDMTPELGPLRVIPGSHRDGRAVPKGADPAADELVVPTKAGTAVFFDAGLIHSGSPNQSDADRVALFPYFGHYFVKRMDGYFTQPLPADLLHAKDPLTRQLLGMGLMPGAMNYHGDDENYNRGRGEEGIDFPARELA